MSFLNPTGVTTLWSRMINYLTGSHVKTSVVSGATDVDGALTKLQTKAGTATLTTTAKNLSGAVNELKSNADSQSQQIDVLEAGVTTLQTDINNLSGALAHVENGNTASKTYKSDEYVLWKNVLYTVKSGGLPQGTAISTAYLDPVNGGGFNKSSLFIKRVTIDYYCGQGDSNIPESRIITESGIQNNKIFTIICEGIRPIDSWDDVHAMIYFRPNTGDDQNKYCVRNFANGGNAQMTFLVFYKN